MAAPTRRVSCSGTRAGTTQTDSGTRARTQTDSGSQLELLLIDSKQWFSCGAYNTHTSHIHTQILILMLTLQEMGLDDNRVDTFSSDYDDTSVDEPVILMPMEPSVGSFTDYRLQITDWPHQSGAPERSQPRLHGQQ
jgi:hypothetical protein